MREEHITPNGDYSVELLMRVPELDYLTKREREALIAPQGHTSSVTKNTISALSIAVTCVIPSRRAPSFSRLRAWFIFCAMTPWPF